MELIMPEHHPQTHHARVRFFFFFFFGKRKHFFLTGGCNLEYTCVAKVLEKKKKIKKKQACMYVYLKKNKSWDWER